MVARREFRNKQMMWDGRSLHTIFLSSVSINMTSPYPSILMGVACISGGITGFLRTGSKPSLIAGMTVGALYLWSGGILLNGDPRGYYGAAGASAILFLSSLPRFAKGPVPALLTVLSAVSGAYYYPTVKALQSRS
ncbi:hypothetical protein CPB86DRAFT_8606 [Serendipita vermifera]|nr:hypothetical protein CPB86DRAFT_8606 [Serendipita vermifera]